MNRSSDRRAKRARFVHLGDRLSAIARIGSGACTRESAARQLGVSVDEVRQWERIHAAERTISLGELRGDPADERTRLQSRLELLSTLVSRAEREVKRLNQLYLRSFPA